MSSEGLLFVGLLWWQARGQSIYKTIYHLCPTVITQIRSSVGCYIDDLAKYENRLVYA